MGGFFLLCGLLILTFLLFIIGTISKAKIFAYAISILWILVILLGVFSFLLRPFTEKKVLDDSDFYGSYIIDRSYFKGPQTDWQYNNYRFEIKKNDSIYFYKTNGAKILNTYIGSVSFINGYSSTRLDIDIKDQSFHITKTPPTIYRDIWDFILVFNSDKFHNMYFKKGTWNETKD